MTDGDFDPALFGLWPKRRDYGEGQPVEHATSDAAFRLILDRKAADGPAGDELLDMLNGMTRELREQMQTFQMLRLQADRRQAETDEDIDRKLAQADAKASIEAMSLIVRTLEKIDSLQRTLAQDRDRRDEEMLDDAAYRALVGKIEALVEQRVAERSAAGSASQRRIETAVPLAGRRGGADPPDPGG